MRALIVIPSIRELKNLEALKNQLINEMNEVNIVIIDEGEQAVRATNDKLLYGLTYTYFGPREREDWFKSHFGSAYEKYLSVIPKRCHAETSFGFLVAYEDELDVVIEMDDDVFPVNGKGLLDLHMHNLDNEGGQIVRSDSLWYNTIENLRLSTEETLFPRGHPYAKECRVTDYHWEKNGFKCILNMGLWKRNLDLDALTILYHKSINGTYEIKRSEIRRKKVVIGKDTYFAVCSMNTSFRPIIIPAFYQLYMNYMSIDRFDDIWSGLFLKKIADHLGDALCIGEPLMIHNKTPRNTYGDLKAELEGMRINETLWKIVKSAKLEGNSYFEAYTSLIQHLENSVNQFLEPFHKKFMELQLYKMNLWLKTLDMLK